MRTLNLGIVAHVDAGKTSLSERLLYAAGVIDTIGSVDAGTTVTDTLALERQRGITIKSAVTSFAVDDVVVNLIDTPGHPDFIAEVERALGVLDGAILVVSAAEGVQAQTRVLMRTLRRLGVPTLLFVNKIDRAGAEYAALLRALTEKLVPDVVAMGTVDRLGSRAAASTAYAADDTAFTSSLTEVLSTHDDTLLAAYVDDETTLTPKRLRAELVAQTAQGLVHPVFFGSAVTGTGVEALLSGLAELLPARGSDADGALSGSVFKVERGRAGEKIAYVRLVSGTLRNRDRVVLRAGPVEAKVTALTVYDRGTTHRTSELRAGQIGRVWGLDQVRVGDPIGQPPAPPGRYRFARPTLETVVEAHEPADRARLHTALSDLTEQDPLIGMRQDPYRGELSVMLYGEVQKQVIAATLADEYDVEVGFGETSTLHLERPIGAGASAEQMGVPANPFRATVGLRVDPAPIDSGVRFRLEVELGSLTFAFVKAIEETVHQTLAQGLHGWQVTDCTVTLTESAYTPPPPTGWSKWSSSASDFRHLTPLVLISALRQAGTQVHEPIHRFRVELPSDTYGTVLPALTALRAMRSAPMMYGATCVVEGDLPAAQVHRLEQRLPGLTHGEGVVESWFDHWAAVRGVAPARRRTDHNPLDRKDYLMRLQRN